MAQKDFDFTAKGVDVRPSTPGWVSLSINCCDVDELVASVGASTLLQVIGKQECLDYFGIEEADED